MPPFDIEAFKAQGLVYGGARPGLFQLALTPPPAAGLDLISARKFEYAAQAASIPESNLGDIQVPYFGRKIKVAGDRDFADWNVTIMNDEDFGVRSMFEKWSNAMNRLISNTRQADMSTENYKADMEVIQYSKTGEVLRAYQFVGAWPKTVSSVELDWNTTNTIETFSVTFAYDYWDPIVEISSKVAGGINQYGGNV